MTTPTPTDRRIGRGLRWLREIALTGGAIAGLVCIIAAIAALAFGIKPVVFRSGSMSPTISSGALAVTRTIPAAAIGAGDIVSVIGASGERITHRVVNVESFTGNTATLQLQGDANAHPDPAPYAVSEADRVIAHVSGLGYFVAWLSSPAAFLAAGLLGAALLVATLHPNARRPRSDDHDTPAPGAARYRVEPPRHARRRASVAPTGLATSGLALLLVLSLSQTPGTYAAFTDSATATTGSLGAASRFVPRINTAVSCSTITTPQPTTTTLTWEHLGPAYDYKVILRDLGGVSRGEWAVNSATLATQPAHSPVTFSVSGAGLAGHPSISELNAEIHTVLRASGEMSTAWAGHGVYQDGANSRNLRCSARGAQDDTSPPYAFPAHPTKLTCDTQGLLGLVLTSAKLTWTGTSTRFRLVVTDVSTGGVVRDQTNTDKTTTLTIGLLDLSFLLNPTQFIVSVYSVDANGVTSPQGLSWPIATALLGGLTGLRCAPDGNTSTPTALLAGRSMLPEPGDPAEAPSTTPPTGTATPNTTSVSENASSSSTATSTPARTTTTPGGTTSTTTPPPSTTTTSPAPPTTEPEQSAPLASPNGKQDAIIETSEAGRSIVVRDASGTEIARAPMRSGDTVHWLSGTGQLWIISSSGVSYLDPDADWSRVIPEADAIPAEIQALR